MRPGPGGGRGEVERELEIVSGPPWRLQYANSARKDLRRIDPPVRRRILSALERLAREGVRNGVLVRLRGRPGLRLRVGDWRAIVELDAPSGTIRVKRVGPAGAPTSAEETPHSGVARS
jgi:mRNA interferase RelE/StbE